MHLAEPIMNMRSYVTRSMLAVCAVLALAASASAETFTLTDKQGRSIKADVLSVQGDQVKIKREDGQTFNLSLATLSDEDQRKLKAWAAANPPPINASDVAIEFSRAKFSTEKQDKGGATAHKELWGYSIKLSNKSRQPLNDLRAEYILFVKQDLGPGEKDEGGLRRLKARSKIDALPVHESVTFRTEGVTSYRYTLKPGFVWSESGNNKPIRDTLAGMWLRIYAGDQLVIERIVPEDLAKTEKW